MTGRSCSKRDIENLQAIIRYCEDIEYLVSLHGSDEEDFFDNISLQYGCAFSLIQIGEHTKLLSVEFKETYPEIDWRGVAAMRDFTVHNYPKVHIPRMRSTVLEEVPLLKEMCQNIMCGR